MTTLITGAAGFVISNVARYVASEGEAVVAADLVPPDDLLREHLAGLPGEVTFRQVDLVDAGAVRALVAETRPERVIHGAALTASLAETERTRFARTVDVNVGGTARLLEALRDVGTGRIVVVSSGSIYGPRVDRSPCREDDPPNPVGVYPLTKWAAEALARRFADLEGLDLAVVRLAAPYGPMERDTGSRPLLSAIHDWARDAVLGGPIVVREAEDRYRDVVHVADVASGIGTVALAARLPRRVYNVGLGEDVRSSQILETLQALEPGLLLMREPGGPVTDSNPVRGPLASDRLRGDLGWQPRFDLRTGLADYLAWLRSHPGTLAH